MERLSLEEENIIKDIRNLFRVKTELNDTAIKDVRNLFRLKKEAKGIKDIVLRNVQKYKSNRDKNKISVKNISIKLGHT